MAQVARAVTEAAGGPESLLSLSVQFRGMGRLGEGIVVSGTVRDASEGEEGELEGALEAVQAEQRIIRNALARVGRS